MYTSLETSSSSISSGAGAANASPNTKTATANEMRGIFYSRQRRRCAAYQFFFILVTSTFRGKIPNLGSFFGASLQDAKEAQRDRVHLACHWTNLAGQDNAAAGPSAGHMQAWLHPCCYSPPCTHGCCPPFYAPPLERRVQLICVGSQ